MFTMNRALDFLKNHVEITFATSEGNLQCFQRSRPWHLLQTATVRLQNLVIKLKVIKVIKELSKESRGKTAKKSSFFARFPFFYYLCLRYNYIII